MINHFNYTNRKRIPHQQLQFVWLPHSDGILRFNAALNFDLPDPLPADAKIFIEAYSGPIVMRFPFGSIGDIQPPGDTSLVDFPPGLKPSFRVKVVDISGDDYRLLAWARDITARSQEDAEAGRRSILPVETVDLGPLVWNIRLEDNSPVLQLNAAIREPRDITSLAKDADFISLVYPPAIHRILNHLLLGPERDSVEQDHDWLVFAHSLAGRPAPDADGYHDDSEFSEEVEIWIHEVVKAFCARQGVVESYIQFRKEAEERHG